MGEAKLLTEEMIDEKLAQLSRTNAAFIDPMKMAAWSIERCCAMADDTLSKKTVERAIATGELPAYKVGAKVAVVPQDFLTWLKRHRK